VFLKKEKNYNFIINSINGVVFSLRM
jgi:hypothetical protein